MTNSITEADLPLLRRALDLGARAHDGQRRKWGAREPYFVHPLRVAVRVLVDTQDPVMVCAAILHDTLEDTAITEDDILDACGVQVLTLVKELTNHTHTAEWLTRPREEKRVADREHLARASEKAKIIKLHDRADNLEDMKGAPASFLKKYVPETQALVDLIGYVRPSLAANMRKACDTLESAVHLEEAAGGPA